MVFRAVNMIFRALHMVLMAVNMIFGALNTIFRAVLRICAWCAIVDVCVYVDVTYA